MFRPLYYPKFATYLHWGFYTPFGSVMGWTKTAGVASGRQYSYSIYRYGFNGQRQDNEIAGAGNHNTAQFWEYDTKLGKRWNVDPKPNPSISNYGTFELNPIRNTDLLGDSTWLYATTLPGSSSVMGSATHTFIVVKTADGVIHYYVYGPKDDNAPLGGSPLIRKSSGNNLGGYQQDHDVYNGIDKIHLKQKILISAPENQSTDEFDQKVIEAAGSFGNNPDIQYSGITISSTTGNCNTSTTTILSKAGISKETIKKIDDEMPGINQGFGSIRPWTKQEQEKAVKEKKTDDEIHKENDSNHKD